MRPHQKIGSEHLHWENWSLIIKRIGVIAGIIACTSSVEVQAKCTMESGSTFIQECHMCNVEQVGGQIISKRNSSFFECDAMLLQCRPGPSSHTAGYIAMIEGYYVMCGGW